MKSFFLNIVMLVLKVGKFQKDFDVERNRMGLLGTRQTGDKFRKRATVNNGISVSSDRKHIYELSIYTFLI